MKTTLLCLWLTLVSTVMLGQTAYIQVNGEPGLEVYLNGNFKGKTTAEYSGLIIENVSAGKNLIKIVKAGYTPYEEYVTIQAGEVFAYKVKLFTKHLVQISEQGNTAATTEKATLETGKLIIQSVPIEIKITIPDIEGIKNSPKTKDEWLADQIPVGSYTITFTYNQKVITKTIAIDANNTTSVFVNMLNGEFTINRTFKEKEMKDEKMTRLLDSICNVYNIKIDMSEAKLKAYNPEAAEKMISKYREWDYGGGYADYSKKRVGPWFIIFNKNKGLSRYDYMIYNGKNYQVALDAYNNTLSILKSQVPEAYITHGTTEFGLKYINLRCVTCNVRVDYNFEYISYNSTSQFNVSINEIER